MTATERILEKSKEAFIMAIEIYNKPTLKYRLEGFSFFICNAWELMLKAYLIERDGEDAIYYHDKPNRTISLENCIQKVFTNEKSPLRKNLDKVIELRNTSTHFITEEYESVYTPLLQACVFNFVEKMMDFHNVDMTQIIPENFITLSVRINALDETEIRGKYTKQIAEKLISVRDDIEPMVEENNSSFAIKVEHYHYLTKDKNEATEVYRIDNTASEGVRIIKELKNPNNTHKYNAKACIKELNKRIVRDNIPLKFRGKDAVINNFHFRNFTAYFGIKENEKLCFVYQISKQPQYSYSQQAIDFIYDQIKSAPEKILDDMHEKLAEKKPTPGAKEF